MDWRRSVAIVGAAALLGCSGAHYAPVTSAALPPPPQPAVLHTARLWITFQGQTDDTQCVAGGIRPVCFENVTDALAHSLHSGLWPSFPEVAVKEHGDELEPGDYVLLVVLELHVNPPDGHGPGWSAGVRGHWQLVRDGFPVTGETVSSRSRADFAYGSALGAGAGEVLDAVSVRIASVLGRMPESQPAVTVPLPPVVSSNFHGPRPQRLAEHQTER